LRASLNDKVVNNIPLPKGSATLNKEGNPKVAGLQKQMKSATKRPTRPHKESVNDATDEKKNSRKH